MQKFNRRTILATGTAALGGGLLSHTAFAAGANYQGVEVPKNGGRLSGTLKYAGPPVDVPEFQVTKDEVICGEGLRSPRTLRVADNDALGDCVVQLRGVERGKPWDPVFSQGKIYQISCSFQPYVQIVNSNAQVEIFNYDDLLHNIHAYEMFKNTRRSLFNFAQPQAGQRDTIDLKLKRGNVLMIDCNAHNWMSAWVYTSPNPYLDVTSIDGKFEIPDIPPGHYELVIWHPILGEKTAELSVAPDSDLNFELVLS